jgi:hypothetical protein
MAWTGQFRVNLPISCRIPGSNPTTLYHRRSVYVITFFSRTVVGVNFEVVASRWWVEPSSSPVFVSDPPVVYGWWPLGVKWQFRIGLCRWQWVQTRRDCVSAEKGDTVLFQFLGWQNVRTSTASFRKESKIFGMLSHSVTAEILTVRVILLRTMTPCRLCFF